MDKRFTAHIIHDRLSFSSPRFDGCVYCCKEARIIEAFKSGDPYLILPCTFLLYDATCLSVLLNRNAHRTSKQSFSFKKKNPWVLQWTRPKLFYCSGLVVEAIKSWTPKRRVTKNPSVLISLWVYKNKPFTCALSHHPASDFYVLRV